MANGFASFNYHMVRYGMAQYRTVSANTYKDLAGPSYIRIMDVLNISLVSVLHDYVGGLLESSQWNRGTERMRGTGTERMRGT